MEGSKGVTRFIANVLLKYNNKQYYASYDRNDTEFHRFSDGQVEYDEKAKKLLDDVYPIIEQRCYRFRISEHKRIDSEQPILIGIEKSTRKQKNGLI